MASFIDAPAVYTPKKFCVRLTTNTTALIQWVEPMAFRLEVIVIFEVVLIIKNHLELLGIQCVLHTRCPASFGRMEFYYHRKLSLLDYKEDRVGRSIHI